MREIIETYVIYWFEQIALLFTTIVMVMLVLGYDLCREDIVINLVTIIILTGVGNIIWRTSRIKGKLKWGVHYLACLVGLIMIQFSLDKTILIRWDWKNWSVIVILFTSIYIGLSAFYTLRNKHEEKWLNNRLQNFKRKYTEIE